MLKKLIPLDEKITLLQNYLQLDFSEIEIKATATIFGEKYDYFFSENEFGEMNLFVKDIILKKIDDLQNEIKILKLKI